MTVRMIPQMTVRMIPQMTVRMIPQMTAEVTVAAAFRVRYQLLSTDKGDSSSNLIANVGQFSSRWDS